MEDLRVAARLVRWASRNLAFNLDFLPADRWEWKPDPAAKSPQAIMGEVIGVMRMAMPVFAGGAFAQVDFPQLASAAEAKPLLIQEADAYAAALDAAGPELDRLTDTPGGELLAAHAVLFPLIDLLHHHGQIIYLQSLLGDAEAHFDHDALAVSFRPGT